MSIRYWDYFHGASDVLYQRHFLARQFHRRMMLLFIRHFQASLVDLILFSFRADIYFRGDTPARLERSPRRAAGTLSRAMSFRDSMKFIKASYLRDIVFRHWPAAALAHVCSRRFRPPASIYFKASRQCS